LTEIDPETAQRIHPNDPQRIQRALEVYELTGEPMSQLLARENSPPMPYHITKILLAPGDRAVLHRRIEDRFAQMLQQGLVEEVEKLRQRGDLSPELPSIRAVGYRQVWEYLEGKWDDETMRYKAVVATRQYAKRQMTWLRSETGGQWYNSCGDIYKEVLKKVESDIMFSN
jgi:tRNA dimethylallyltransferase